MFCHKRNSANREPKLTVDVQLNLLLYDSSYYCVVFPVAVEEECEVLSEDVLLVSCRRNTACMSSQSLQEKYCLPINHFTLLILSVFLSQWFPCTFILLSLHPRDQSLIKSYVYVSSTKWQSKEQVLRKQEVSSLLSCVCCPCLDKQWERRATSFDRRKQDKPRKKHIQKKWHERLCRLVCWEPWRFSFFSGFVTKRFTVSFVSRMTQNMEISRNSVKFALRHFG